MREWYYTFLLSRNNVVVLEKSVIIDILKRITYLALNSSVSHLYIFMNGNSGKLIFMDKKRQTRTGLSSILKYR